MTAPTATPATTEERTMPNDARTMPGRSPAGSGELTRFGRIRLAVSKTVPPARVPRGADRPRRLDVTDHQDQGNHDPEALLTIEEAAAEIGMSRTTTWALIQRQGLERYRLPGRGKTTFVKRGDVLRAKRTPIPLGAAGQGKAAA